MMPHPPQKKKKNPGELLCIEMKLETFDNMKNNVEDDGHPPPPPPNHMFQLIRMVLKFLVQGDKARVVQTLLFVQGINTLLQTLFGTRLPTVIGASYAYMVPIISIIHDSSFTRIEDPHVVSLSPLQF